MKKVQVEGITGAVAIVAGLGTFVFAGGNFTNAILAAAGAGFVTLIVVSVYNALAR